jgi:hypothetical protein
MMAGVATPSRTQWSLTVAGLCSASVVVLHSLHLISTRWAIGLFFAVVIPLATFKVFMDFRER